VPRDYRKLLKNQSLGLSVQVTDWRLKNAGVTLDRDLGLAGRKRDSALRIPSSLTKRLAGNGESRSVFIERRPAGDYAIKRSGSVRASAIEPTQAAAIERAREISPNATVHVERVRHPRSGSPHKWRKL
jgi:hypothetical protein